MCHIHFIKPIGNRIKDTHVEELVKMFDTSGKVNKDGYGYFTDKVKYRNPRKFKDNAYTKNNMKQSIIGCQFVIGHNRYITSGENKKKHTHPIETDNTVYVHNGHISNYQDIDEDLEFDSLAIGRVIEDELKKDKDMVKAITNGFKKLSGNLSVFLYDKRTHKLYYMVKSASFEFRLVTNSEGETLIVGNTAITNLNRFGNEKEKQLNFSVREYTTVGEFDLYQNTIYEITDDKGIVKVGEFELKPYTYRKDTTKTAWTNGYGYAGGYGHHGTYRRMRNRTSDWEDIDDEPYDRLTDEDIAIELEDELKRLLGHRSTQLKRQENGLFDIYASKTGREILQTIGCPSTVLTIDDVSNIVEQIREYKEFGTTLYDNTFANHTVFDYEDLTDIEDRNALERLFNKTTESD